MTRSALLISLALLVGCGGSSSETTTASTDTTTATGGETTAPSFAQVSVDEVEQGIQAGNVSVYAAASPEVYAEHHVPGATRVDADFSRETLPEDTSRALVFYCGGPACRASHGAAERAIGYGFSNVSVMGAGISGWVEAGKPVETGETAAAAPAQN